MLPVHKIVSWLLRCLSMWSCPVNFATGKNNFLRNYHLKMLLQKVKMVLHYKQCSGTMVIHCPK